MATLKLSAENIDTQAQFIADHGPQAFAEVQSSIYTMIGGGFLAMSAVRQPHDFYIDSRVGGLPYSRRAIEQAVKILARAADIAGIEHSPEIPDFRTVHMNLGVF